MLVMLFRSHGIEKNDPDCYGEKSKDQYGFIYILMHCSALEFSIHDEQGI